MQADRVVGLVVAASGVLLALASTQIRVFPGEELLSARSFPYLLGAVLIICGLALVIRPGEADLRATLARTLSRPAVLFAVALCAYALTFRYMDYRLGTWLFLLATMWILGSRRVAELLVAPAVLTMGSYLLFSFGFSVVLPTWN